MHIKTLRFFAPAYAILICMFRSLTLFRVVYVTFSVCSGLATREGFTKALY